MERKSLLVSKGLGRGRSKRELFAHDSSASFFFSYNVWFCLFAFNVFITYRLLCGTTKAEFYFQQEVKLAAGPYLSPGGGGGEGGGPLGWVRRGGGGGGEEGKVPLVWIRSVV